MHDNTRLQKAPKRYASDHKHIYLLRHKTFAVIHPLTQKDILRTDFTEKILHIYKEMLPFRRHLNEATTV